MNIRFKVLLLHVFAGLHVSSLLAAQGKQKQNLDEQVVVGRISTIKKAFDIAIASNEVKRITTNLVNDFYGLYRQVFNEAKKHYHPKDAPAVKQYLLIIKDTLQKIELVFTENQGAFDVEKLAGIIFLSAFKIKSLEESNAVIAQCIDQTVSSQALVAPFCRIAQDLINLFLVLAEHAKKQLRPEDIKMLKLTENVETMKNIAKLFDGDLKNNLIKAQLWGPKISQQAITKIALFWISLAPAYLSLKKQVFETHLLTIMHTFIAMTDEFIAQTNCK